MPRPRRGASPPEPRCDDRRRPWRRTVRRAPPVEPRGADGRRAAALPSRRRRRRRRLARRPSRRATANRAGSPLRGIDQVVLAHAAAQPGALGDAARREAAALERDDLAPGQPDRRSGRSSRGRLPAETQPSPSKRERVVDGLSLDDAVQVELRRLGAQEHAPAQEHRVRARARHRLDRAAVGGQQRRSRGRSRRRAQRHRRRG